MLRLLVLLLALVAQVAAENHTAAMPRPAANDTDAMPPTPPGNGTAPAPLEDGECDTTVYHLTPQGQCNVCPEGCPKECDPASDAYMVFATSDCDGAAISESDGAEDISDAECDTSVYHVTPQGQCKKCGDDCPKECNPNSKKYLVYESEDCDGNGTVGGGGGGGGDPPPDGETADDAGEENPQEEEPTKVEATDAPTSGGKSYDAIVFLNIVLVGIPVLFFYWNPFD